MNHSKFKYGDFINALVAFLIIAAVIYFAVVLPVNRIMALTSKTEAATTKDCPECLSTIPIGASRCMYCTAVLVEQTAPPAAADVPQQRRARTASRRSSRYLASRSSSTAAVVIGKLTGVAPNTSRVAPGRGLRSRPR